MYLSHRFKYKIASEGVHTEWIGLDCFNIALPFLRPILVVACDSNFKSVLVESNKLP